MKKHFLLKLFATVMLLAIALTVFAACDDVNVEVTFIVDDEVYAVVNLQDGNTVEMPEDPKKEDCVFGGWYLDKGIWEKPFIGKVEDTTIVKLEVYARWSDTPCSHIWSPWTEGIPATCHSVGKQGRYCLRCGKGEVADIEMLEHNFVNGVCINEGCDATDSNYIGLVFHLNDDGESYSVSYQGTCTETEIVIPAEYRSKPVTTIRNGAFSYCRSLAKITIPESVIDISGGLKSEYPYESYTIGGAFYGCDNLQFNEYDNGLYLGNNDNPYVVFMAPKEISITSCEINNKTKVIASRAFCYMGNDYDLHGCRGLTSITIPNSVTHIGHFAFAYCEHLFSVTIPDDSLLTSIGFGAFGYCSFMNITLPNKVTSIGDAAFSFCRNLAEITIPDSVTSIGYEAFACSDLRSITIPSSVTHIGGGSIC